MDFIIDAEKADEIDFSQASIYLDACFIISYFDKEDVRRSEVARLLDLWSDFDDVRLGISNHTVSEVINRLFQMIILGSLEIYHFKNKLLNQTKDGYHKLTETEREKLVNLESAQFLHRIAKKNNMINDRGTFKGKVMDLVKLAKQDEHNRIKLDTYYILAVNKFREFISQMSAELDFKIEFLASEHNVFDIALAQTQIMQIDIQDSFHVAIAHSNNYDYFATLDSDFLYESILDEIQMQLILVA